MSQKKRILSAGFLLISIFIIPFYCVLPEDPHDPSKAKMSIILQGSDGIKSTTFISDSTGKTVKIGMVSFLPEHIDSFNLKIVSSGIPDTIDTTFIPTSTNTADTLWKSIIFSTPGTKAITITPFSSNNPITVEANITIYGGVLIANKKPLITVSGKKNIVPGTICRLTMVTIDPDTQQTLKVSISGNPEESYLIGDSLFIWEFPETFSGNTTILFMVADNGTPPLSDTEKVTITVSSDTAVNQSPKWNPDVLVANIGDTALYSLDLAAMCSDPDRDQLTYSVFPGTPAKDTVIGSRYTFKATTGAISRYNVNIVAVDPQGARDTLTLSLTIESKVSDTTAPMMTLVAPAKDSGLSSSSAYTVDIICSDGSGVASVSATVGGTTVPATRANGHFTMAISGLPQNVYTAITITATDSSAKANKCTKVIYVKYGASFTLVYSGNESTDGTIPVDTARYQAGAQVTVKNNSGNLVKTGSTFAGWNTAADGNGTSYDAGSTFTMGTANDTLFAKWTPKPTYALTISATNGSVTKAPDLAAYDSGAIVTLTPVPTANYHFTGWSGTLTGITNPASVTMNSAKSVTATFAKNQTNSFALTVMATNGAVMKTPDLPQYDSGSTVSLKATPTAGFSFANWSGDATGTADSTTIVMSAVKNITANFAPITHQLTVSTGTGSGGTIFAPAASPVTVNQGAATAITASPNSGYKFNGWSVTSGTATFADPSLVSTTVTLSSGNATVAASFARITYQLTITAETGGTISTPSSPSTVNYGAATTITASPGEGYSFNGWVVTSGSATIPDLLSATTTVTLTSGDAVIKAQWTAIPYSITYTLNGGQQAGGVYPATYSVNTSKITLPGPTKTAYVFDGWYNDSTLSGNKVTAISAGSTGNKTLYAKWVIKDIDGNVYTEVKIGNQVWMVENFKATKHNDGTLIPLIEDSASWVNTASEAYCWFNNDINSFKKFGAIYKWFSVNSGKLAPSGWHVPTNNEWDELENYLILNGYNWDGTKSGNKIAKSLSAKTSWANNPTPGVPGNVLSSNNSCGFTALAGGSRDVEGFFCTKDTACCWWSSTVWESDPTSYSWSRYLVYSYEALGKDGCENNSGNSIRLIRD